MEQAYYWQVANFGSRPVIFFARLLKEERLSISEVGYHSTCKPSPVQIYEPISTVSLSI